MFMLLLSYVYFFFLVGLVVVFILTRITKMLKNVPDDELSEEADELEEED